MKLKIKTIVIFALIALIPIIIMASAARSNANSLALKARNEYINKLLQQKADDINYRFLDMVESSSAITKEATAFVEASSQGNATAQMGLDANLALKVFVDSEQAAVSAVIVDNSGKIIASDDESRVNTDFVAPFNSDAVNGNGFSDLMLIDGVQSYYIVFNIYSNNEKIGTLYRHYKAVGVREVLISMSIDSYTYVALVDADGNIMETTSDKTLNTYSEIPIGSAFGNAKEVIGQVVGGEAEAGVVEIGGGKTVKLFGHKPINASGWYLVSITERDKSVRELAGRGSILTLILFILVTALVILATIILTTPVDDLLKTLQTKQKGNMASQFSVKTKDEYRLIADSFNKIFENIFDNELRYRTIVEMSNNITFEISLEKDFVHISKNFNKKFSLRPRDDTFNESFFKKLRLHKDDQDKYERDLEKIMSPDTNALTGEYRIKNIFGDFCWFMIKGTKFFNRDDKPSKIIGVIIDVDKEKKSEMSLMQRANFDALTKLHNRESFLKQVGVTLETSMMKKTLDAVMFIDLDDFKGFNDNYDHSCGDEALKFVADTLKEISFERGFAGRFGGDEFVMCLTGLTVFGDSGKVAQEIIDTLSKGFEFKWEGETKRMPVRCSIGIAFLRESGKTVDEIMSAADTAMYDIKKKGKSNYAYAKASDKNVNSDHLKNSTSTIEESKTEEPDISIDDVSDVVNDILDTDTK